jgi:RNA polymerase sigma-70 factor, ECF subfamily
VAGENAVTRVGDRVRLARLAAAARGGDAQSVDRLLAAARPLILRWARRLVNDPAAAEDVAQDALLEAYRTLGTLRAPDATASWLYLVARKHADRHRRKTAQAHFLDLTGPVDTCLGSKAEQTEGRADIRRALMLASDADRLLLVLRYYGDWPESDLAALLGITCGAVRKRLHDARRRLAVGLNSSSAAATVPPVSAATLADPWERLMTDVRALLGASHRIDDPMPGLPAGRPPLSRPAAPERLATGIKALDTLVPLPRGGVVDMTGQVGTGHLALLAEILNNLAAVGPAALVAVSSARRLNGVSARLWKLLEPPAPAAALCAVITAPPEREAEAADLGARIAGWLAHGDATVLLVVDEPVAREVGPDLFIGSVGTCASGPGSVTGVLVAPHAAGASPAAPWPDAETEVRTGAAEMIVGRFPALDILASHSALLDGDAVPAADRAAARQARELLASAAEVRDYLAQPLRITEPATGIPGQAVPADEAVAGLTRILGATTQR